MASQASQLTNRQSRLYRKTAGVRRARGDFRDDVAMSGMWFVVCIPKKEADNKSFGKPEQKNDLNYRNLHNGLSKQEFNKNINEAEDQVSMKQALQECLDQLGIQDAVWSSSSNDRYFQVYFPCESGEDTDLVLRVLTARGIGVEQNSTVGVMPCAIFYRDTGAENEKLFDSQEDKLEEGKLTGFKAAQQKFLKSVTARLTVAQVVDGVRSQGELNFDFVAFILLAGMIAGIGLMDNSVVSIIAAMLVSPLMGPIMSLTFGITIRDKNLIKLGLRTELVGLAMCLTFGFILGIIMAYWGDMKWPLGWSPEAWPNAEMTARGQWRSLWVGALVALPSGGGVAMAILGGNSACLVGVAISASLLPPSINCGILWSLALMKVFKSTSQEKQMFFIEDDGPFGMNRTCETYRSFLAEPTFKNYYFSKCEVQKECAVMAINSFCLTVVNIICIIIAGSIFLKIKEIAPESSLPRTQRFWKHDIKVARDYNRTIGGNETETLGQEFLKEWANISGMDPKLLTSNDPHSRATQIQTLQDILMDAEEDEVYQTVMRKVANQPTTNLTRRLTMAALPHPQGLDSSSAQSRMSIWDIETGLTTPDSVPGNRSRRPSQMVSNLLSNFERRQSKSYNLGGYDNPDPPTLDQERPVNLQSRRRSSVMRQNLSYWPSNRFSVSPVEDDAQTIPSRISRTGIPPVLEEERGEDFSRI